MRSFFGSVLRTVSIAAAGLGAGVAAPHAAPDAHATVIESVVAIVGERPILLSELRLHARPLMLLVQQKYPPGATLSAAQSQVYRQTLDLMITDELERKAAANSNELTVTSQEIDRAIEVNARNQKLTADQLVQEALNNGFTEPQYRDMIRRQLLELKLMQIKLAGQIRITEDDLKSAYRAALMEARRNVSCRLAWIVVHVPRGLAQATAVRKRELVEVIAERARAGANFSALARHYSEDPSASNGGLLPTGLPSMPPTIVDREALGLEVSETSPPLRVGDDMVVIKVVQRDKVNIPTYEQARGALQQQVYGDKLETAKKRWIESLRKRTHIEVRL